MQSNFHVKFMKQVIMLSLLIRLIICDNLSLSKSNALRPEDAHTEHTDTETMDSRNLKE